VNREPDSCLPHLSIAGVVIRLESGPEGPPATVDGSSRAFVVDPCEPDVRVRTAWGDLPEAMPGRLRFDSGGLWQLHERDGDLHYSFRSPIFGHRPYRTASFDREFRRGVVTLDRASFAGRLPACPLEYPLDELVVINRLAFEGGVEIHGCGVIDADGAGYLFAGQSGAGKSTISRLWAAEGATVISDDRVVLRSGHDGLTIHGTPWHGDAEFAAPVSAPLSRILLLRQAPRNALIDLPPAHAAAWLFACAFPVFHDAGALERTLALLASVVESVPVEALEFTPTASAISFARALTA
jgi:hypothetical protein